MLSTGFPGDSDPRDEEPEWECPECRGVVVAKCQYESHCLDCGKEWDNTPEPDIP